MDRFSEKQARIAQYRADASALYPTQWSKLIAEWNTPDSSDRVWLTYSANYLFRMNNVRWAIDPLTLGWRIKNAPKVDVARDLSNLCFVLLTHGHKDHLDMELLFALRHLPITWVVPEFILSKVIKEAELPVEKIIVPSPLKRIELNGIHILPFDGLHWETAPRGGRKGVSAMGYLIEWNGRRYLFPGDTRTYDATQLPIMDSVDVLFAHLWLGRGSALMDKPTLLDTFCRFLLDLSPRRLILTHLNELGRDAGDFWDETHVELVRSRLREVSANIQATHALMGESVLLEESMRCGGNS
jgi:L-ascorbate metabolism protein UlaG (beta-lactamase superfamily)